MDVTQEDERVTPQSEKNGFWGARLEAPSQTQLVCTTPRCGFIASVRRFDCVCSTCVLFWISDNREAIYRRWWQRRSCSLMISLQQSLWRRKMFQNGLEVESWQRHFGWFRAPRAFSLISLQTLWSVFLMNCREETTSRACTEELFTFCSWLEEVVWSLAYLSAEGSQVYQTLVYFS